MDMKYKEKLKKEDCDDCGPDPFGGAANATSRKSQFHKQRSDEDRHEHKKGESHDHQHKDVFGNVNKR
jgi:hypothetical protein